MDGSQEITNDCDQWMEWNERVRTSTTTGRSSIPCLRDLMVDYVDPDDQKHMSLRILEEEDENSCPVSLLFPDCLIGVERKTSIGCLPPPPRVSSSSAFRVCFKRLAAQKTRHYDPHAPITYPNIRSISSSSFKTAEAFLQESATSLTRNVPVVDAYSKPEHDVGPRNPTQPESPECPPTEILRVSSSIVRFQESILNEIVDKKMGCARRDGSHAWSSGLREPEQVSSTRNFVLDDRKPQAKILNTEVVEISSHAAPVIEGARTRGGHVETALARCSSNLITVECPDCHKNLLATADLTNIFCPICGCYTDTESGVPMSLPHIQAVRGSLMG